MSPSRGIFLVTGVYSMLTWVRICQTVFLLYSDDSSNPYLCDDNCWIAIGVIAGGLGIVAVLVVLVFKKCKGRNYGGMKEDNNPLISSGGKAAGEDGYGSVPSGNFRVVV